jgi:hypothetical protein
LVLPCMSAPELPTPIVKRPTMVSTPKMVTPGKSPVVKRLQDLRSDTEKAEDLK